MEGLIEGKREGGKTLVIAAFDEYYEKKLRLQLCLHSAVLENDQTRSEQEKQGAPKPNACSQRDGGKNFRSSRRKLWPLGLCQFSSGTRTFRQGAKQQFWGQL